MALKTVIGGDPILGVLQATALSTSYLGADEYIVVTNAERFDLWVDDDAIGVTIKVSLDAGTTFSGECKLAAGFGVLPIACRKGDELTIDIKSASGTPNVGGIAYSGS